MFWTHPSIALTATLDDLRLAPLTARILHEASLWIDDTGLRALLTTAILSTEPHRIRTDPDRTSTGFHLDRGRSLRAAAMARALLLCDGPTQSDETQVLITAVMLGNLTPAGTALEVDVRRDWLHGLAATDREHLAAWGCEPSRADDVIELSVIAAHRHVDQVQARASHSQPASRMLRACQAAALARPLLPRVLCDPIPLPAWMDPDRSWDVATRLLEKDLSSTGSHRMLNDDTPILTRFSVAVPSP